MRKQNTANK